MDARTESERSEALRPRSQVARILAFALVAWLCPAFSAISHRHGWRIVLAAGLHAASCAAALSLWAWLESPFSPSFVCLFWAVNQALLAVAFWEGVPLPGSSKVLRCSAAALLGATTPAALLLGLAPWNVVALGQSPGILAPNGIEWALVRSVPPDALRPGDLIAVRCPHSDLAQLVRLVALPGEVFWLRAGQVCRASSCLARRHILPTDDIVQSQPLFLEVSGDRFFPTSWGSGAVPESSLSSTPPISVAVDHFGVLPDDRADLPMCAVGLSVHLEAYAGVPVWGGSGANWLGLQKLR